MMIWVQLFAVYLASVIPVRYIQIGCTLVCACLRVSGGDSATCIAYIRFLAFSPGHVPILLALPGSRPFALPLHVGKSTP